MLDREIINQRIAEADGLMKTLRANIRRGKDALAIDERNLVLVEGQKIAYQKVLELLPEPTTPEE